MKQSKLEKSEAINHEKLVKHKDYVYDKIYELKNKKSAPSYCHSQKECTKKIEEMTKEQDRFNSKLIKMKEDQESFCTKISPQIKMVQKELQNLEKIVKNKVIPAQISTPLNLSLAEGTENEENIENEENDLSTISEIVNLTHPNDDGENVAYQDTTPSNPTGSGRAEQNLDCETPEFLHLSLSELFPANNSTGPLLRTAIKNRYHLDYTESPVQLGLRLSEGERENTTNNQSFLVKRRPAQLNL